MKECDGNCRISNRPAGHVGEVLSVKVIDPQSGSEYTHNYCSAAIAEDVRNGFLVELLEGAAP